MKKSNFDVKVEYPSLDAKEKIKFLENSLFKQKGLTNFYKVLFLFQSIFVFYLIYESVS